MTVSPMARCRTWTSRPAAARPTGRGPTSPTTRTSGSTRCRWLPPPPFQPSLKTALQLPPNPALPTALPPTALPTALLNILSLRPQLRLHRLFNTFPRPVHSTFHCSLCTRRLVPFHCLFTPLEPPCNPSNRLFTAFPPPFLDPPTAPVCARRSSTARTSAPSRPTRAGTGPCALGPAAAAAISSQRS